jgi:tetratricopeptide (TPR) repeat protein
MPVEHACRFFTEDVTKARPLAEKVLELAQELNASESIASSYLDLGNAVSATGEKEKAVECIEKALRIALDNGYVVVALRAYNNLANELPAEENERKLDCYEKALELAKKPGDIFWISLFGNSLAGTHFGMGNSDKALTLAEQSESLDRKTGNLWNLSVSTSHLGALYHCLGEWDKGEQYAKESLGISKRTNNAQSIANSYNWLGWSYYDKGEYAKAKEFFDEMAEINEKRGAAFQIFYCQFPAMNDMELGEIDRAKALLDGLHEFAHEKQNKQLIVDEDAIRAMLFRAEKKWTESIELFEKSLQENEALGARQWNVYFLAKNILCEYARVYLERNQPDDKEKTCDLLNQALEMFQKTGAKKDVEKVEAKLLYMETGKLASAPKPTESVATGYADLDKLLCGGIGSGSTVVLTHPHATRGTR